MRDAGGCLEEAATAFTGSAETQGGYVLVERKAGS